MSFSSNLVAVAALLVGVFTVALCQGHSYSLLANAKPHYLQVNAIPAHEIDGDGLSPTELETHAHLPMVELVTAHNEIRLPSFSWQLPAHESRSRVYNDSMVSFEIELYYERNSADVQRPRQLIWSSGTTTMHDPDRAHPFFNMHEEYPCSSSSSDTDTDSEGAQLRSLLSRYKWKILSFRVRWRSRLTPDTPSQWSRFGRFILTSGAFADWNNATFIAHKTDSSKNSAWNQYAPLFRKQFTGAQPKANIASAVISVVGLGWFRLWVDDHDILADASPQLMQVPGWTNTEKRVPYVAFDVTYAMKADASTNANQVLLLLGEGYRNTSAFAPRDPGGRSKQDNIDCVLKLQLLITYNDKSQQTLVSSMDGSWQTTYSGIFYNSVYDGERFDENLHAQFDQHWSNADIVGTMGPPGVLYPSVQPYVSIVATVDAVEIYPSSSGLSQIVNFGINNAGLMQINIAGLKKNTEIRMHFAEVKQHPPYGASNGDLYYLNLRSAQALDTFKSAGNNATAPMLFQPFMTIHGFQFVEIFNYPRTLTKADVKKSVINAAMTVRANWSSSDATLVQINKNAINSQISNLQSVITDCAQRDERLGWMGDASLSSDSLAVNFDMQSFASNELVLMKDEQTITGSQTSTAYGGLPDVVPFYRYGNKPSDPNWGQAFPQWVQCMSQYYNATTVVAQYMSDGSLDRYLQNLKNRMPKSSNGADHIAKYPATYGDWCPPPPNPKISNNFAGAFGYIQTVESVLYLANVMKNTSYVSQLTALRNTLVSEFVAAFYDSSKGQYLNGLQTSYAMSLAANLYSDSAMQHTLQTNLLKQIQADKNLLTTGIIGAKFLLPILTAMGDLPLALSLIKGNQDFSHGVMDASYPSWAYEFNNTVEPATAMWELWDSPSEGPGMDSRNHHMFSSVSHFLTTAVSGLMPNGVYNEYRVRIGHLAEHELQSSRVSMANSMMAYDWRWSELSENGQRTLEVVIEVGIGCYAQLEFDVLELQMNDMHGHCRWTLADREADVLFDIQHLVAGGKNPTVSAFAEKYGANVRMSSSLSENNRIRIGSGHYEWNLDCSLLPM